MKGDVLNTEFQSRIEAAVVKYQLAVETGDKIIIEDAYQYVIRHYDPLDFVNAWYDQYHYLFDTKEDFIGNYLGVFATVLLGWKPKDKRGKSRYDGTGEFKNYFIGSLYHNYVNMVKSDQAAKRNLTLQCPICQEWVNPISTHLITYHSNLLWEYLHELELDVESLTACPFCPNFKIAKASSPAKVTELIKAHFVSKHTSLLFTKFNELYPHISTISPKVSSVHVEDGEDELDVYDIIEDTGGMLSKILLLDLSDVQKSMIECILNGENNLVYRPEKYKCTKDEWDCALQNLQETMSVYGYE